MVIELPKFENSSCLMLTACGELRTRDLRNKGSLRSKDPKVARYKTKSGTAFVRAWLAGKPVRYLHVDCALRKFFPEDKIPKTTHKKADVLKIIDSVIGSEIDMSITGCFEVPINKLPERSIIRSLSVEQKAGDMSIRLTGGIYALTGAPVKEVHWRELKERKRTIDIRIKGENTSMVSESYLNEMWDWINDQFSLFVLGKTKNGTT